MEKSFVGKKLPARNESAKSAAKVRPILPLWGRSKYFFLALVGVATLYLALQGLGNHCFWDDEATTAILARNFIKTGSLTAWDGRNLWTYRNGTVLDDKLCTIDAPGGYLPAAISFKVFGFSNWAGRLPFVILGLATLVPFWLLLSLEFPDHPEVRYYALLLTALSYSFLLNIRQCRYYALGMFFGVASYYLYRRALEGRKFVWFGLMTISLALMFYSNYLLCAALLGGMALVHLVFHLKSFTKTDWVKAVSAAILFAVLTLPYTIAHRAWVRPDIPRETQSSYLAESAIRFYLNLRELDLIGYVPGFFLLAALVLIIALRKRISLLGAMCEYGVLILGYVLTLSAISMQPVQWMGWRGGLTDIRFLVVILPFSACLCATLLSVVHRLRFGALLAALAASVLLCTNLLSFRIADQRVRWLLPGYIYEIHAHFDTPYDAAVRFLESNASTDDIVYSIPEDTLPVLQWYLGDRLRMQGLLRPDTSLPRDRLKNLAASLFITDTFPQWVISFGRQQVTDAALKFFSRRQYDYSCDQARATCSYLDVYCRDMTRPELPGHNFGPVSQVGPGKGIYIFGRHH